jgi:hypothetical protein
LLIGVTLHQFSLQSIRNQSAMRNQFAIHNQSAIHNPHYNQQSAITNPQSLYLLVTLAFSSMTGYA